MLVISLFLIIINDHLAILDKDWPPYVTNDTNLMGVIQPSSIDENR